ncbi:histamine N-methyltransferase-like [Dunckerocampus dactyliophorus]|uniref:histamine N-methyltransferase-like n=1 Tax=Dunckerocampus dactyliophorus TaxID=161453 RepID=UPI0024065B79|nr:histamine N-methyltransferase-like [Dunckerocampus dactyliophorus]XP_054644347.1 histamine N-methyltransferase-like [Dunckerocampus dactyliophorus]XP_054644348.1 histamine N-methyltransferase-like [Dunckerocampus dactyliophorus]
MAAEAKQSSYDGSHVENFEFYLQCSGEHESILHFLMKHLPEEFERIGADKSGLAVLGVGSGGGEVDVQMLSLMQSTLSALPITADIVEGSTELVAKFKGLVTKTDHLQKIPFTWHTMLSEEYMQKTKGRGDVKTFDFIHMIQMLYYVDDLTETIKFYHSLLNKNGRLMIIIESANSGWDTLWRTFSKELCNEILPVYRSSSDVLASLKSLGLKYEEHFIPNTFDITECFDPNSKTGQHLISFMTGRENFYQSFTPRVRADILNVLRSKCSTEKEGKVSFNSEMRCVFVYA